MKKYLQHKDQSFLISLSDFNDLSLQKKVWNALEDCFHSFLPAEDKNIGMSFLFTDHIETFLNQSYTLLSKNVHVSDKQIYFKGNDLGFIVNRDNPCYIIINIKDNENIFSSLRIFNKAFKNNIELQISVFYYRIFLFFSQLWNLENRSSYIHAAAIEIEKEAVVISADSGVGKSSLLFRISQQKEVDFIADDLAIVSCDSEVFYQGRALSVKPYHLEFYHFLKDKLQLSMNFMQRIQWSIMSDKRLTHRIKPSILFSRSTQRSNIKRVVHLCNHNSNEFKIQSISAKDFCNIIIPILMKEQFLAHNNWNMITSFPDLGLSTSEDMYRKSREVFEEAFKECRLLLVYVPYRSDPNLLYEFLKREGCLD